MKNIKENLEVRKLLDQCKTIEEVQALKENPAFNNDFDITILVDNLAPDFLSYDGLK